MTDRLIGEAPLTEGLTSVGVGRQSLRSATAARMGRAWRYLALVAGSAGARLSSFLATVIIARSLGPSGFGDFSLFFALLVPFTAATGFVDITYVRHANTPDGVDRRLLLRASIALKALVVLLLVAGSYPFAALLARYAFGRPELAWPLAAAAVAGALIGMSNLWASTFLAAHRYVPYSILNSLFYLVVLIALVPIFVADLKLTPKVIYLIYLGTAVALGAVSLVFLLRETKKTVLNRSALGSITTFAKWLVLANIVEVLGQRLDIIAVAHFVTQADVGLYGAALRISVIASLLTGALSGFLMPRVARALRSKGELAGYLRETLSISALIVVSIGLLWLTAPYVATGLFGDAFSDAAHLTRIILLGTLFTAIATPLGSLFLAEDRPHRILVVGVGRIVLILGLTIALVPSHGASGAAWAYAASEAFGLAYAGVFVLRQWRRLATNRDAATEPAPT